MTARTALRCLSSLRLACVWRRAFVRSFRYDELRTAARCARSVVPVRSSNNTPSQLVQDSCCHPSPPRPVGGVGLVVAPHRSIRYVGEFVVGLTAPATYGSLPKRNAAAHTARARADFSPNFLIPFFFVVRSLSAPCSDISAARRLPGHRADHPAGDLPGCHSHNTARH